MFNMMDSVLTQYSNPWERCSMRISTIAIAAFVLFVVSLPFYAHASCAAEERFENLSTREGVTVHSWVISPRKVRACVVLVFRW